MPDQVAVSSTVSIAATRAERRRTRRQAGFSLIELLIVIAIILVIAAIALPRLDRQRQAANELAAIGNMRVVHQAQANYYSTYGKYAANLTELGPPTNGQISAAAADLIPTDLAQGRKNGYLYTMTGSNAGYSLNADPEIFGSSGRRTFFSDQSLVIRQNMTQEKATVTSPELK